MRQLTFTTIFLTLLMCMSVLQLQAQVTIDHNNFSEKASYIDSYHGVEAAEPIIPEGGANMVWDYSGIAHETAVIIETEYHDATDDPDFPTAMNYVESTLNFDLFDVPYKAYRQVDESGFSQIGSKVEVSSFSITALSGGPDDVLRFPGQVDHFEGKNEYLRFPMNYQDQWIGGHTGNIIFELTVAAFGLDQTPGVVQEVGTDNVEVIGYGHVIIPMEDGSASNPVEVLLVKTVNSRVTNYFVGGAPAPEALLNAFGFVQGEEVIDEPFYSFVRPGFSKDVLRVRSDGYIYRPQAVPSQSSVVINREDFPREASFTETAYRVETDIFDAPSQGTDQVWDYSFLTPDELSTRTYFDATDDSDFPDALNYSNIEADFAGNFPITVKLYEAIDENRYYYIGEKTEEATYPLTAISGGVDDILQFPAIVNTFTGPDILQFPLTYEREWTQNGIGKTSFELTVAAFGLNATPGENVRYVTESREVVGEGKLIIPTEDGSPSIPMDALLLKIDKTYTDSLFVGGAPAPAPLLAAFGLTQGNTTTSPTRYVFYTPGFGSHVLNVNPASGNFFYKPQAAATSTEPINISHNRVCDVPTEGQSQVTVVVSGGAAPYQVSGNFNGEIEEGEPFIFILEDNESSYDIIVVDADGNEAQVFETGLIPCTKLPVELLAFEGEVQTEGNLLQWTTASELNNQHFVLSYSITGQNFLPLQKVAGNGTTSTENRYEFLHQNVPKGTIYYQLSQTDFDGTTKNLGTISLKRGESTGISSIEVYPTATSHQLNISYSFGGDSNSTTLKVYDMTSRVVKSQNLGSNAASLQLKVNDLKTGTYILRIENGLEVLTQKFVKW